VSLSCEPMLRYSADADWESASSLVHLYLVSTPSTLVSKFLSNLVRNAQPCMLYIISHTCLELVRGQVDHLSANPRRHAWLQIRLIIDLSAWLAIDVNAICTKNYSTHTWTIASITDVGKFCYFSFAMLK
jgi:hypothetical protein